MTSFINSVLELGQSVESFFVFGRKKVEFVDGGFVFYPEVKELLGDILQLILHELGLGRTLGSVVIVNYVKRRLRLTIDRLTIIYRTFRFGSGRILQVTGRKFVISFFEDNVLVASLAGIVLLQRMIVP
jgi:hypothetical protein